MFFVLFRVQMIALWKAMFNLNRKKEKSAKPLGSGKIVLIAIFAVYVLGSLFFSMGMIFHQMATAMISLHLDWIYFIYVGMALSLLCFMGTVFASQSQIFDAKDNDLLMSMPIKPRDILLSRVLSLWVFNLIYTFMMVLPGGIVYYYALKKFSLFGFILLLVGAALIALFIMTLSTIIGWLIGLITSKMRNKSLLSTVLMVVFLALYLYLVSNFQRLFAVLTENADLIGQTVKKFVPPLYYFSKAVADRDILSFALLIFFSVVPFVIMYLVLAKSFAKIATTKKGVTKKKYVAKEMKVTSTSKALLIKEWRHFLSLPMYIMNCSIGVIFEIILAGYIMFNKEMVIGMFMNVPEFEQYLPLIVCLLLSLFSVMTITSAPALSLEGKNLPLLQSMPINPIEIYRSKILLNVLIALPSIIISGLACWFTFGFPLLQGIFMLIVPLLAQIFAAVFGMFANILFPRFDWVNEIVVIKQSGSVMLSMLGGMGIMVLPAVAGFLLAFVLDMSIILLIISAFFATLIAYFYQYIKTKGVEKFYTYS